MKFLPVARGLSIALLLASVAGCDTASDPASLIAKSQAYSEKGDFPAAIIELRNVLQDNPDHVEARYLLGKAYLDSGEVTFATVELQKAAALGYDPKRVLPELAKSLILEDKAKEALEATDPASVPGAQGSPEILNIRSVAQLANRQLAAAKASVDLAMVLRPDYADGILSKARIAIIEGEAEAAPALVDRAIALEPKNLDAWLMKGNLARQAEQIDLARKAFHQAIEINPRSAAARLDLALLEIEAKHYEDAARELEAVREIAPKNVRGFYLKTLLELRLGNAAAALESIHRALEVSPRHVPSMIMAGIAELALGHPDQAEKYLSQAVEVNPRNMDGRKVLANSLMQRGQFARAVATLEPILDVGPGASDAALLALAGDAYMQNKQYAKAIQYFQKAAALDPGNAGPRMGLGMSRLAVGETDRAVADLQAAAALGKSGTRADIMLVMLNLRRNEFDQALKAIAKLEQAQPTNTLLYNLKAAAYMGKGDTSNARAQFEKALSIDPGYFPAAANLAQLDLQAGNATAARGRYDKVLEKDKDQIQAMLALADLASRTPGQEKVVLDWIARAKAARPESSEPYRVEIDYYRRTGQSDKALALAIEQKRLHPNDPDALATIGRLLLAAGHAKEAAAAFGDRTILLPNSHAAFLELGNAQLAAKDPGGASASLRKALRLKPNFPEARALLVQAELAQDRGVPALQVAREVQNDLPGASLGYVLEGDTLMAAKKFAQAAALYEKAYGQRKSALVAIKIYTAWSAAGKPEQGESKVKEWLAEHPDDVDMRRQLAYGRLQRGKYALAIEQYRLVLERRPQDPVVLNNLAWAMYQMKDPAALSYAQKAHQISPGDGGIADTLGLILIETGDLTRGVEILQKAVAASPSNLEIRYHLAQALAKSGEKAKAISQLEIVVGSGSKFPLESEAIALLKQLRR